jgi:hypothetical protein
VTVFGSAVVTVTGSSATAAFPAGASVTLSVDIGTIDPTVRLDGQGKGTVTFRADQRTGPATVHARMAREGGGGVAEATTVIQVVSLARDR